MNPIAFFSAEYAFEDVPIFAGGLGVLASDFLREAAQHDVSFVGLGLFYRYGFAPVDTPQPQRLDIEAAGWHLVYDQDEKPLQLSITVGGEVLYFQVWQRSFGKVTMYLLDCDVASNTQEQRQITSFLYHSQFEIKLQQDLLLGIGGTRLLQELGITPYVYHLNEGHSAFAAIELMAQHKQLKPHATFEELCEAVTQELVATKHTALSTAGIYISHNLFMEMLEDYLREHYLPPEKVFALAQDPVRKDDFTTTRLMLTMARITNSVSRSHSHYEDKLHPGSEFHLPPITNGINLQRWQDTAVANTDNNEDFWAAHQNCKQRLIDYVNSSVNSNLQCDILTVVWARRITAYKRPLELFFELNRLARILTHDYYPIQVIIAGKPNVEDEVGVEMAREISEHALNPRFQGRIAYVQEYSLELAHKLVSGADVWLNTPEKGYEASGTSGMKAGANGVLQCSVSDGWVDEVDISDSGWVLPEINTADAIYGYLEYEIAPLYYDRDASGIAEGWLKCMWNARRLIEDRFTTTRMLEEYKQQLYGLE